MPYANYSPPSGNAEPTPDTGEPRARLIRQARSLTTALAAQVHPGIGLWDPLAQRPTQADHYGQLSAALALRCTRPHDDPLWRVPFDAWLETDSHQLGHAPFNRLLLQLLRFVSPTGSACHPDFHQGPERYRLARRYPSNNWALLAQACRLLETASGPQQDREATTLATMLQRWMTSDGGFIDFPQEGNNRGLLSTPTAYHHKALFVCTLAFWHCPSPALADALKKLLRWVILCWDGDGYVGGFGRSTHSLFGDVCLLSALELLGLTNANHNGAPWGALVKGVLNRWATQQRPDGLLHLTPSDEDNHQGRPDAWDNYMHLSVYNAWAGALLGWTLQAAKCALPGAETLQFPDTAVVHDSEAGLMRVEGGGGLRVLMSSRGQPPQAFSREEVELRYAGGQPYHVAIAGKGVTCPPAIRVSRRALFDNPTLAGWTPLFMVQGELFGLAQFDTVEIKQEDRATLVHLEGHPVSLLRMQPRTPWQRLRAGLEWRFSGRLGRRSVMDRPLCRTLRGHIVFRISRQCAEIQQTVALNYLSSSEIHYLNPGGHALLSGQRPPKQAIYHAQDTERPAASEFNCTALPASLTGAIGYSLPSMRLEGDSYGYQLTLNWAR